MEAAFFDLDKTVIAKASMVAFGRPLLRAGHDLAAAAGPRAVEPDRLPLSRRRRGAHAQVPRVGAARHPRLGPGPHPHARARHAHRGDRADRLRRGARADPRAPGRRARVFIISASPEEIVAPLGRYLGVDEAIASRAASTTTAATPARSTSTPTARSRPRRSSRWRTGGHRPRASYAYSDSTTDLPMLEVVGTRWW